MTAPLDTNGSDNNPLLSPSSLPHGAPPLAGLKPEHFLPALTAAIAKARQNVDNIKNNPAAPSFENTIEALEFSEAESSRILMIFSAIAGNNADKNIRALQNPMNAEAVKFGNDVMLDDELFARVKAVYDVREALSLNSEQRMLLENTYKGFVRSGALLDEPGKQRLREIDERMSELTTLFNDNNVHATAEYQKVIDDESQLAGLPERAKKGYKQAAIDAGMPDKWIIKLSPPPVDIAEYCENRALREEIYKARTTIGFGGVYDNRPVILEEVRLRNEKAQLLGYPSYAAYVLDDRMAKTPEAVNAFLDKNLQTYRPAADAFLDKVKDFARQTDGLTELKPWDLSIYARKLKEKTFNIDTEQLRPYFELEAVLDGLRRHAEKLFNISMQETKGKYPVYHPDVRVYEVKDNKTGEMIGLFYADYFARAGAKRNGAWCSFYRRRGTVDGENLFSIVNNTCNFDKPAPGQPALLSINNVTTIFHEFGHALHTLLAEGNYTSQTCTAVKRDFVELPSQLQERWVMEKDVLDTFARHHETGEALPADMIEKLHAAENFNAAYAGSRQTFLAMLDMAWHTADPDDIQSVEALEDTVIAKAGVFAREGGATSTGFSHIFSGGYAVGYYGYKWAEVLDADVFSAFQKNGLYDQATAERLRETIYSKGGSVDPMELFKQMMGREPDPDALFRREGLLNEKPAAPSAKPKNPGL